MSIDDLPGSSSASDSHDRGAPTRIYLAFVPWVLFTLIAQHGWLQAASVAALAVSVAIMLPSALARRPKVLEIGAVVAFIGFTAVAFGDPAAGSWLGTYARAIAAGLLALIAFCSLLLMPFTEQYAREQVPRQFWSSPQFRHVNRRLTLMWALVFTAMAASHVIAGAVGTRPANILFNWVVPIILIVWAAKRTTAISEAASQVSVAGHAHGEQPER